MPGLDMELIESLRDRVRLVEQRLAQVERPIAAVNIPAMNELRYSLVHLLRYLCNDSGPLDSPQENMRSAVRHAKRAHYDCSESEVLFYFREFAQFEECFKRINLLGHIPDYLDWSNCYHESRDLMNSAINDRRDEYCDQLEEKLVVLRPIHRKLQAARIELFKYIDEKENENSRLLEQLLISQAALATQRRQMHIAAAAAVVAAFALLVAYMK